MEASKDQLNLQDKLRAALALGGIAIAAFVGVDSGSSLKDEARGAYDTAHMVLEADGSGTANAIKATSYTQSELAQLPHTKKEVARKGDGFYDMAMRANKDADMAAIAEEGLLLQRQLKNRADRAALWPGDTLRVPIIPPKTK